MTSPSIAILAGGCFWGMEDLIRDLPGVVETQVGYTGGALDSPDYKQVKTGKTGHAEAIRIAYDSAQTSYRALLEFFFQIHDPSTAGRQGNDIGSQYRSVIFYLDADQKREAEKIIAEIDASRRWPGKVVTEVVPAGKWWDAEEYHQDYLGKYPEGYTCHFIRPAWKVK